MWLDENPLFSAGYPFSKSLASPQPGTANFSSSSALLRAFFIDFTRDSCGPQKWGAPGGWNLNTIAFDLANFSTPHSSPTLSLHPPRLFLLQQSLYRCPDTRHPASRTPQWNAETRTRKRALKATVQVPNTSTESPNRWLADRISSKPCHDKLKTATVQNNLTKWLAWNGIVTGEDKGWWQRRFKTLEKFNALKTPRNLLPRKEGKEHVELHTFNDTSEEAYAAAVYLRLVCKDGSFNSQLVMAKNKLAPRKSLSISNLGVECDQIFFYDFVVFGVSIPLIIKVEDFWKHFFYYKLPVGII